MGSSCVSVGVVACCSFYSVVLEALKTLRWRQGAYRYIGHVVGATGYIKFLVARDTHKMNIPFFISKRCYSLQVFSVLTEQGTFLLPKSCACFQIQFGAIYVRFLHPSLFWLDSTRVGAFPTKKLFR
jgi:hypothetical protein